MAEEGPSRPGRAPGRPAEPPVLLRQALAGPRAPPGGDDDGGGQTWLRLSLHALGARCRAKPDRRQRPGPRPAHACVMTHAVQAPCAPREFVYLLCRMGADYKTGDSAFAIGPVPVAGPAVLAPLSGRDRRGVPPHRPALRRGPRRLRDGGVGRARPRLARRRGCGPRARGSTPHVVQLAGCDPRWMGEAARARRGGGARDHRHQHGLPGQAGDRRLCGLGPDARPRPGGPDHRRDGRGRLRAGHGQDAARLGRGEPQRAGARPPRRGARRQRGHGPRPHAPAILQGRRRLGRASPRSSRRSRSR